MVILSRVGTRVYDSSPSDAGSQESRWTFVERSLKIGVAISVPIQATHRNQLRLLNTSRFESFIETRSCHRDSCRGHRFGHEPSATGKSENRDQDILERPTIRFTIVSHNVTARTSRHVPRGDSSGSIQSSRIAARNWADCGNCGRVRGSPISLSIVDDLPSNGVFPGDSTVARIAFITHALMMGERVAIIAIGTHMRGCRCTIGGGAPICHVGENRALAFRPRRRLSSREPRWAELERRRINTVA